MIYRPGVNLSLWQPEKWDEFLESPWGQIWWTSPCVETKQISLQGGQAIIFMGHERGQAPPPPPPPPPPAAVPVQPGNMPPVAPVPLPPPAPLPPAVGECLTGPFDNSVAIAYLGDTVVFVDAPTCFACVGRRGEPDPYDTPEGMEAVLEGLRLRMPGE